MASDEWFVASGTELSVPFVEVFMIAIRLPEDVELRLEKLARRTGRTKSFYVREAILEHLEDLEDAFLAEERLSHPAPTVSLNELMHEMAN